MADGFSGVVYKLSGTGLRWNERRIEISGRQLVIFGADETQQEAGTKRLRKLMSSVSKAAKARLKESFQVDPHSPKADGVKKVCFDLGDASVKEEAVRPFAFSVTARDSRRVVLAARDDSEFSTLWNLVSARPAGEARREPLASSGSADRRTSEKIAAALQRLQIQLAPTRNSSP